ncbi:hypothetical protein PFICI_12585 [Pestalotiopsis fici W106-1]|uniref:DUF3500 domain-containing protein n=1 Tax=Pestalotiopsis fici (strain W106-1 / CGMCC3.15140) TaxID=1229662 RepID=W3WS35_PESFW|nr:uncharacterized protein PFICI_12585 [Pestalotiopsis fici W106-1]ETS75641.1 hypothetical protein PFICI_12585 [Pestalotiopsis fici W106-1]
MLLRIILTVSVCAFIYKSMIMMCPCSADSQEQLGAAQTAAITNAAQSLLALLDSTQHAKALLPYETLESAVPTYFPMPGRPSFNFVGEQYGQSVWSNFPVSDVLRPGLRLGDLTPKQHGAVMELLRATLSDRGYRKVQEIMGSDQALADEGVPYAAGRAVYTIAIFGEPSPTNLWMIQFGGHHLALNMAIYQAQSVLSPVLTGAMPANYMEAGVAKRVLADENDKAFALFDSFDNDQRAEVSINHPVSDVVYGPGEDGKILPAVGLKASMLNQTQQAMLFELIAEWAGILNDVHAAPRLQEIRTDLQDTFFAWSGPSTHEPGRNGASYFRIQGPNLLIEFSPQFPGGDLTNHVHTIYRDPLRSYGRTLAREYELL